MIYARTSSSPVSRLVEMQPLKRGDLGSLRLLMQTVNRLEGREYRGYTFPQMIRLTIVEYLLPTACLPSYFMIHVIATVHVVPNRRSEFLAKFSQIVPDVRAETGCIEYGPT